jgi:hypothetical protein
VKQVLIDFGFIGHIASVAEGFMALATRIFDEEAAPPATGQATRNNLSRKCAHEWSEFALQDRDRARIAAAESLGKTGTQNGHFGKK